MALELGESFLENMIGLDDSNSSTDKVMNMIMVIIMIIIIMIIIQNNNNGKVAHMGDCQRSSLGDEFFHSKSEYGVKMMESVAANLKLVPVKPANGVVTCFCQMMHQLIWQLLVDQMF